MKRSQKIMTSNWFQTLKIHFGCLNILKRKNIYFLEFTCSERDQVPEIRFLGTYGISWKMGLRQVEQGFSSFFARFLACLMIFQIFCSVFGTINFEKSSNLPKKNEEKPCQIAFIIFLHVTSKTQNPDFSSIMYLIMMCN